MSGFSKVVLSMFIIYTIIVLILVFVALDLSFTYYFIIGYLIFCILLAIYAIAMTIIKLRKLTRVEIRNRFKKFFTLLLAFWIMNYLFNNGLKIANAHIFKGFSTALGLAYGLSFLDLLFFNKRKNRI